MLRLVFFLGLALLSAGGWMPPAAAQDYPTKLDSVASQVAVGERHACALALGGRVSCWGHNLHGQLGHAFNAGTDTGYPSPLDTGLTGMVAIAAGASHTCALSAAGTVKCWGRNSAGQLGHPANAGTEAANRVPLDVVGLGSVAAIAAGGNHTCALTTAATVKCWGSNSAGELGNPANAGTGNVNAVPLDVGGLADAMGIAAGAAHTCALRFDGSVKCWGRNLDGQLGNGATDGAVHATPGDVTGISAARSLAAGTEHTCVVTAANGAKCWGQGDYGRLGIAGALDQPTPVDVFGVADVAALALGEAHSCALLASGAVKCWGHNLHGELGNAQLAGQPLGFFPAGLDVTGMAGAAAIAAGARTNCVATAIGGVKCWGRNDRGQLGVGAMFPYTYTHGPARRFSNGAAYGARGMVVAGVPVNVPLPTFDLGERHACATTDAGTAACWGSNTYGQLGSDAAGPRPQPVAVAVEGLRQIVAGLGHTCAVTEAGGVKCWGRNLLGEIGGSANVGTNQPNPTPSDVTNLGSGSGVAAIAAGAEHTCALTTAGAVKCWGSSSHYQLYVGGPSGTPFPTPIDIPDLAGPVAIAAGARFNCALTAAGGVRCWGENQNGELGNGSTALRVGDPQVVQDDATLSALSGAVAIAAGDHHACALISGGTVKCWGSNSRGQLAQTPFFGAHTRAKPVAGLTGVTAIAAGPSHTCASTATGTVKCWGNNEAGELGLGTADGQPHVTPADVTALGGNIVALAASSSLTLADAHGSTCALSASGVIECWGSNAFSQLGNSGGTIQSTPRDLLTGQTQRFDPPALSVGGSIGLSAVRNGSSGESATGFVFGSFTPGTCSVAGATLAATAPALCGVHLTAASGTDFFVPGTYAMPPARYRLLRVRKAAPSLAVASSADPVAPASSVTFTATLANAFAATGNVHFCADAATTDASCSGGTLLCSVAASASPIQCSSAALAVGTHAVTAYFTGDGNNLPAATTSALAQRVGIAAAFTSAAAATFTIGDAGSFSITATGTPAPALSLGQPWPAGVGFTDNGDGTGTLSGTPAPGTAGGYVLQIRAQNGMGPDVLQSFELTIDRRTPDIAWPQPAAIVQGTALGAAQLNASASDAGTPVAGSFVYAPPAGTVLGTGAGQVLGTTFTPDDPLVYDSATAAVTIDVLPPPIADLQVDFDADRSGAQVGETIAYTLVATNAGPAPVSGARLVVTPPVRLGEVAWECVPVPASGADCPDPALGTGTLDANLELPAGAFLRFELFGTVLPAAPDGGPAAIDNTASIALPAASGLSDPQADNDTATASVLILPEGVFADGFEAAPGG